MSRIVFRLLLTLWLLFFELILTEIRDNDLDHHRTKLEEYCGLTDKICPPFEQCLLIRQQIKQQSLLKKLENKETALQFLHSFYRIKRFSLLISKDSANHEYRREDLSLYEHYCESVDHLPRSCFSFDHCKE